MEKIIITCHCQAQLELPEYLLVSNQREYLNLFLQSHQNCLNRFAALLPLDTAKHLMASRLVAAEELTAAEIQAYLQPHQPDIENGPAELSLGSAIARAQLVLKYLESIRVQDADLTT